MSLATLTETEQRDTEKLNYKKILPIFVIVLIDLLGFTIIIPLMPLYATAFGGNALMVGFLGAAYPLMQFIGAPLLGRLSDRFGRKPVLLVSQLGTLIGFLILGFANTLGFLFLARIVDGLSGANISTAQAAITDSTTKQSRTQGLGLIGAAFGLGFILGPIIAFISLALSGNNYHVPAFVAAVFSLTSIGLTWFWFDETLPVEMRGNSSSRATLSVETLSNALRHPMIGFLLVLMFSQQIAFGGFEQLLALFTLNRLGLNASGNALIFVFVGVIIVAVQGGLIGRWSRKFGDRRLIIYGLAALAAGLALTSFTPRQPMPNYSQLALTTELTAERESHSGEFSTRPSIPVSIPPDSHTGWAGITWILLAMIPASIGGGMLQPSINSLITQSVRSDEAGGMLGISAAFLSGANAIAPLIGGAIFQRFGSSVPFLFGGSLMAVLMGISLWKIKHK